MFGQRYGNRPLQAEIEKSEFDLIVDSLESLTEEERKKQELDVEMLKDWYKCDENGEPPTMILTVSTASYYDIYSKYC